MAKLQVKDQNFDVLLLNSCEAERLRCILDTFVQIYSELDIVLHTVCKSITVLMSRWNDGDTSTHWLRPLSRLCVARALVWWRWISPSSPIIINWGLWSAKTLFTGQWLCNIMTQLFLCAKVIWREIQIFKGKLHGCRKDDLEKQ